MNLRTRLSRSNGYRELGMFDESILELEAIEFGEDGLWIHYKLDHETEKISLNLQGWN